MIDVARLKIQLQRTKLQNKDNPLYQLLDQLIGALGDTNSEVSSISGIIDSGGGSSSTVTNINQILQMVNQDSSGDSGGDSIVMINQSPSMSPALVETYVSLKVL